jgi:hypothetical protein
MSLFKSFLFTILSDGAILIERAIGLLLALSGIFVPEIRIVFFALALVFFLISIVRKWIGNHVTVELDPGSSIIRIIDESDHEPVVFGDITSKTENHIKVYIYLKFTNESLNDVVIRDNAEGKLFRRLRFGRKKQIGDWSHLAHPKQIVVPANSVSQPYVFKWILQLPDEFKYQTNDSQYFFRVRLNILRRIPIERDFGIRWTHLRIGRLNPA